MWWKFRRHKVALAAGIVVLLIYLVALVRRVPRAGRSEPRPSAATPTRRRRACTCSRATRAARWPSPARLRLQVAASIRGRLRRSPSSSTREPPHPDRLLRPGRPYQLWGLIPWDRHLIGPLDPQQPIYLLGADRLGRDNLRRIIYGTRVSMSIGLVGVLSSLVLGLMLGGVSGYYGGRVDTVIQRMIEFLRSMPTIPLWMGLAAAIPLTWPPLARLFRHHRSCSR